MSKNISSIIMHLISLKTVTLLTVLFVSVYSVATPIANNGSSGASASVPALPAPTFSIPAGNYNSSQTIALSCTNSNATIRYTIDGSTPDLTSPVYSAPILVSSPTTINAISVLSGVPNSTIATGFYNVLIPASAPTFNINGATYSTTQYVEIKSATVGAAIYYTTDGTDPTTSSSLYTGLVGIDITHTLKAIAVKSGMGNSTITSQTYTIKCATPTVTSPGGSYNTIQTVAISSTTPGVSIRYTTDGSDPSSTNGTIYTVPITINATYYLSLKAIAYKTGATNSDIAINNYVVTLVKVTNPVVSPGQGTYNTFQSITLSSPTSGASIMYTTDGSQPSPTNGKVYTTSVSVNTNTQIIAYAFKDGMANSDMVYNSYSIQLLPADAPTFSPSAGVYTTPQSVTINSTTAGVSYYYTTDGTTPTTSSNLYTGPITVGANTTLTAIAVKNGMLNSQVSGASYIIKCATPSITPGAGTYNTIQSISISCTTPDALIRYTLDGSDPSATNGILYSTPITVNATYYQPIKAIAYKTGITNSDIASSNYIVTLIKVDNPVVSLPAGSYYSTQSVTITCPTPGASFIYTMDGSQPSPTNGRVYNGPITINSSTNLVVYAYKFGMADSYSIWTYYYVQLTASDAPTFSLPGGNYSAPQSITLATTTQGAAIYYTTDGTTPSSSSTKYTGPISISANTTLNAITVKSGLTNSNVTSTTYIINCTTPVVSLPTGTYSSTQSVSLSTSTPGASIYYTTDGSSPSASSTLYTGTVSVGTSLTLKAITVKSGMGNSGIASETYTITVPVVAPVFTPGAGIYNAPQSVSISTTISGASIRYTTDGSTPTDQVGTLYTAPVQVSNIITLKAIAFKSGLNNSSVTSGDYTINCAAPVMSIQSGSFNSVQSIILSDATPNASIYYTTNGTDPTASSTPYTGAISVGANMTLKAIAIKNNMGNSVIASESYTILLSAAVPTMTPVAGTYPAIQSVTLSSTTPNAEIYYTLDGTIPTTAGLHYTGPVTVAANLTLKAIALSPLTSVSPVATGDYVIMLQIAAPQFSPLAGSFTAPQNVTITSGTEGVFIYYTTNGTNPSASGTLYSVPVSITQTTTLKAIALKAGMSDSPVTSGNFVIFPTAEAPTFTPANGTYIGSQNVTISSTSTGSRIRYTTDGSTPSESIGTEYTGPVTVGVNTTFKAIAFGANYANSPVTSLVYNIKVSTPILSVLPGNYNVPQTLTISCSTVDAKIYFTTDGSNPSATNGTLYSNAIAIGLNTTNLKVKAIKAGMTDSDPVSATYVVNLGKVVTPVFTPSAGTYTGTQLIAITSETPGTTIKYTLDGTAPGASSGTAYTGPVSVTVNETLKAVAVKADMVDSDIASGDYKIKPAVVTCTPASGNYATAQSIVLGCLTPGVTIKYTLDGTVPNRTNGITYTTAIAMSSSATLKVFVYKTGMEDGDVLSGDYVFQFARVMTPVFTPAPGNYTTPANVTLSSTTTNATIRYTTDGTAPTQSTGTVYSGPFSVSTTTTINAIAFKTGYDDSQVVSGTYTIHLGAVDTDGDGVPDNQDDYPLDPTRAANNFYPGVGLGSLAFEDNWPFKADYDMNDMVIDYRFNQVTNAGNEVVEIKAKLVLRAMGATFHNGFGIELPVLPSQVSSCVATLKNGSPTPTGSLVSINPVSGLENNQSKAVVILFDDGFNVLPQLNAGIGVNTTPSIPFTIPDTINLVIKFKVPVNSDLFTSPVYNPFIFVNKVRGAEVHLPNFAPTSLANTALFNTGEDNSNPSQQRYYKTSNNLPWAINIYEGYSYPVEKVAIVTAFRHFAEWAQSNGTLFTDWYKDLPGYRESTSIYTNK